MDVRGRWIVTGGRGGSLRLDCWKGIDDDHSIDSIQCDTGVSSDDYLLGKGHLSDLTSCRFFPSGEVILTTSIDMSARLYSIYSDPSLTKDQDPSAEDRRTMFNPRTFSLPHSRSITASAIIGEGREIVTACLDGRLRIWNVSESRVTEQIDLLQVIGTEAGDDARIMEMDIGLKKIFEPPNGNQNDRQGGGEDYYYFLTICLSNGYIQFIDLPDLRLTKLSNTIDQRQALKVSDEGLSTIKVSEGSDLLATGSSRGMVTILGLSFDRNDQGEEQLTFSKLMSFRRNLSPINCLNFSTKVRRNDDDDDDDDDDDNQLFKKQNSCCSLLVAGDDGLPYRCEIQSNGTGVSVVEEFAGLDCDPASGIREEDGHIFVSCHDGAIRIYEV